MKNFSLSSDLGEKIYDVKTDNTGFPTITSYFPLNQKEKQLILNSTEEAAKILIKFKSIFSDKISDQEWNDSKKQIIKKFQDELLDID